MRRLLFLCSKNRWRSPTAEAIFGEYPGVEVDSAGLSPDAEVRLSDEQVEWADVVIVMEEEHRERLNRRYHHVLGGKRIAVLGIPDAYEYMDEDLITLLKKRCAPYLP
jgi:predicted protein tyrosine phosphatase